MASQCTGSYNADDAFYEPVRPLAPDFVRPRVSLGLAIELIVTLFGTFYLGVLPNRLINKMGSG